MDFLFLGDFLQQTPSSDSGISRGRNESVFARATGLETTEITAWLQGKRKNKALITFECAPDLLETHGKTF